MSERRMLRPMEYGEIFNEAFDLYKRNFPLLVGIGAVVYVPYAILSAFGVDSELTQGLVTLGFFVPLLAAYGAIVKALADCYLGEPVTIGGAWRYILRRLLPYMLTWVLAALVLGGIIAGVSILIAVAVGARGPGSGPMLALAPVVLILALLAIGLILVAAFWLAFLPSVMVVEDRFYLAALRRSRDLSAGNWWRIFVVGVFTFMVAYGVMFIVLILFGVFIGMRAAMTGDAGATDASGAVRGFMIGMHLTYGLLQAVLTPVMALPFVLLYFDVRVRKEGFDIELLAREMGALPSDPRPPEWPA